jgi:hypothetical protein
MTADMTPEHGYRRMVARFAVECAGLATDALWQGQARYSRNKAAVRGDLVRSVGGDVTARTAVFSVA